MIRPVIIGHIRLFAHNDKKTRTKNQSIHQNALFYISNSKVENILTFVSHWHKRQSICTHIDRFFSLLFYLE